VRKFLIFIIASLITVHNATAQEDVELNAALEKATAASLSGNVQDVLITTSPRLINIMGGKEAALKMITELYLSLDKQGIKIDTVINYKEMGIFEGNEIKFSFIPQLLVMSIPDVDKKMLNVTTLMATKEPGTEDWTFIDYNRMSKEDFEFVFPELKDVITFPRNISPKPVVIPKEETSHAIDYLMRIIDESAKKGKAMAREQGLIEDYS